MLQTLKYTLRFRFLHMDYFSLAEAAVFLTKRYKPAAKGTAAFSHVYVDGDGAQPPPPKRQKPGFSSRDESGNLHLI